MATITQMTSPQNQQKPAIIAAAFGSSRRGRAVLEMIDSRLRYAFPGSDVYWGYTSAVIRKKTGDPGLLETLYRVEAEGYSSAALLPLQIFPGSEYRLIVKKAAQYKGLRVCVAETLMHRWRFIREVLGVVESDFLPPGEGFNMLALHGTPLVDDPANSAYMGVAQMVEKKYGHVAAASLEGFPDFDSVAEAIRNRGIVRETARLRIIPMTLIAGLHVEDDLLGGEGSWKSQLEELGFSVECLQTEIEGQLYYKSLACYEKVIDFFIQRLTTALQRLTTE